MNDQELDFDPTSLTLDEMVDLEEVTGGPVFDALATGTVAAKTLRGLVWILKRREDPAFTFEDAGKLTIGDVNFADPTPEPAK